MKYKTRKAIKKIQIYIGFPQTWLFAIISIMTIVTFFISRNTYDVYWQSLLSNIFSGPVTGLVLSLLSGTRQIYLSIQERKRRWLEDLHKLILEYREYHFKFLKNDYNGMDRDDFVYDMGASVSWVVERVLQSSFDSRLPFNPTKYCKKHLDFDALAFCDKSNKIRDSLRNNPYPEKNDVVELFKDVDRELHIFNSHIVNDIRDLEVKIATAQRSIM